MQPVVDTPAPAKVRIGALDALRGFALLGILLMNIIPFSMYEGAYDNPTIAGGGPTAPNVAVWAILHVIGEGKMRCLFSLVFGASVMLLTGRLEDSGKSADVYYRRNLWLLLFGIAHAYLLWLGEILYPYAVCALALFPFRKLAPRGLLILSFSFLLATATGNLLMVRDMRDMAEKGRAAIAAEKSGATLNDEQKEQKTKYEDWLKDAYPSQEKLDKDAKEWRGNVWSVLKARAKSVYKWHAIPFYHPSNFDIWSMMLLGMALFQLGWVTGEKSTGFYLKLLAIGYGIGLPLNGFTAWSIIQSNFDPLGNLASALTYDVRRLSMALGHMSLIMLLCRAPIWNWLTGRLAAVGQMAFSNYIMHSVICSFVFTGYGLALYGTWQRYQVYYLVLAIWVVQLIVSPIWLRYYRFGPLEWAWRSLTYWQRQPMRINSRES